ncbi:hypothetical protein [Actinoplanes sp. NPDC026623]|uniref:hypothetical protein n=1 Tax=Actinoplanes sp. NPDC026623 TaxID=3155610 RepID=UPI0033F8C6BF
MIALEQPARASLHAPPVFNTQPWIWQITGDTMAFRRLPLLGCGTGPHHARPSPVAVIQLDQMEGAPL